MSSERYGGEDPRALHDGSVPRVEDRPGEKILGRDGRVLAQVVEGGVVWFEPGKLRPLKEGADLLCDWFIHARDDPAASPLPKAVAERYNPELGRYQGWLPVCIDHLGVAP